MPKRLESFEFPPLRAGGHIRYDWDLLLNGDIWELIQGEDFNAKPQSFVISFRKAAADRDLIAHHAILEGKVVIQAKKRGDD